MATTKNRDDKKTVDLPPHGPRNPDPITDAPGSHPIETGVGAVLGGAASGLAVGTLTAGPIGAVGGAIIGGALAGGLAGKGVGELIDPTTEDNWIREWLAGRSEPPTEENLHAQRRGFRFGAMAHRQYPGKRFEDVAPELRTAWEGAETMAWERVQVSVRSGFECNQPPPCPMGTTVH